MDSSGASQKEHAKFRSYAEPTVTIWHHLGPQNCVQHQCQIVQSAWAVFGYVVKFSWFPRLQSTKPPRDSKFLPEPSLSSRSATVRLPFVFTHKEALKSFRCISSISSAVAIDCAVRWLSLCGSIFGLQDADLPFSVYIMLLSKIWSAPNLKFWALYLSYYWQKLELLIGWARDQFGGSNRADGGLTIPLRVTLEQIEDQNRTRIYT